MTDADVRGEFALETIHVRAEWCDPVSLEGVLDKGGFLVAQVRRRQPDALRKFAAKHQIDRPPRAIHHGNMVYLVGIHQRQNSGGGDILTDGESVGLPAVIGLHDLQAWRKLSDALGHPVFEIPLPPPAVPGLRLNETLLTAARTAGVRLVQGNRVVSARVTEGRVAAVTVAQAGAAREYPAEAFVLASGGFESGALAMDSYGTLTETIFGLPLAGQDAGELVHGDYWGAQQPLFAVGVGVEASMRPVDAAGAPVYPNLYAAGGILAGAYRWSERSRPTRTAVDTIRANTRAAWSGSTA